MKKSFTITALIIISSAAQSHSGIPTDIAESCVVSKAVELSKDNQESAESLADAAITHCEKHLPAARQEIFEGAVNAFGGRADQAERATFTLMNDFIDQIKQRAIWTIIIDRTSKR